MSGQSRRLIASDRGGRSYDLTTRAAFFNSRRASMINGDHVVENFSASVSNEAVWIKFRSYIVRPIQPVIRVLAGVGLKAQAHSGSRPEQCHWSFSVAA